MAKHRDRRWHSVSAGLLLALVAGLAFHRWKPADPRKAAGFDELIAAMARGDSRAVDRAREAAGHDPSLLGRLIRAAFVQESPYARAGGCELLTERGAEWIPELIPRVSDANWLVRMRAIGALSRQRTPPKLLPQRYTPIDQRDQWLLAWLDDYTARSGNDLGAQLCELYSDTRYVEFGKPLADRCLSCHAGREPADYATNDECAPCHAAIYAQWSGSAHAQSLSHLHLATLDPNTGGVKWIDFLPVRGINCHECHRVQGHRTVAVTQADRPAHCPYQFDARTPAGESCVRCHASIQQEWLGWRRGVQPRRAEWPPGQLDLDGRGDERSCVDCHMMPLPAADGQTPRDHRWGARRDLHFLRQAVDLQFLPAEDGGSLRGTLTNLTGHGFPTGTHRRSVRLSAGVKSRGETPERFRMGLNAPGPLPSPSDPPLAPGEQRTFIVPWPIDADSVAYQLLFMRNQYDAQAYTIEIFSGEQRSPVGKPPSQ